MSVKTITHQVIVAENPIATSVTQFLTYCGEARGMSVATIKTRKTHLNQFALYCQEHSVFEVSSLTPAFVDDYFAFYQKTHTKNTTNTGRRILKVFLKWLIGYKEMSLRVRPEAILLTRVPNALPRALDVKDVHEAILHAQHIQDALIITVLYESGIRISELCAIRVEDIDFDAIHIHGKGSIDRTVYISDELAVKLRRYTLDNLSLSHDYLFWNVDWNRRDEVLKVKTARLRIQRCFEEIGIKMTPHQLRHTFAISLLKNGCDIVTIQKLLGHTDIQTTMVYLRVTDEHLRGEYKKYINVLT